MSPMAAASKPIASIGSHHCALLDHRVKPTPIFKCPLHSRGNARPDSYSGLSCMPPSSPHFNCTVPRASTNTPNKAQDVKPSSVELGKENAQVSLKPKPSSNGSISSPKENFTTSDYVKSHAGEASELPLLHRGTLIHGGLAYREKFTIRCYEVGVNRSASIETMANLMQEIGCNHARSVGFSNDGFATTPLMKARKLLWVTTRMHIEMDKYPVWGDVVVLETWFQNTSSIISRRDWIIRLDATNEIIGRATSSWVMMHEETRKLSRIPADVREEFSHLCFQPPRFAIENEKSEKILKLGNDAQFICPNLVPRRSDLDMNHHVNNVTYIAWMLSSIPSSLYENSEIAKITLEYRQECRTGDSVDSLASVSSIDHHHHHIEQQQQQKQQHQRQEEHPSKIASDSSNGSAVKHLSDNTVEFIHLLRFSDDSKREINRGRTVWRINPDSDFKL